MSSIRLIGSVFFLLLFSECSDLGASPEPLMAWSGQDGLSLLNSSEEAIYYFIIPEDLAPLIDWMPCSDPASCADRVPPHATILLEWSDLTARFSSFGNLESSSHYLLYW